LLWAGQRGLVDRGTLLWAVWLMIPMLIGIMIGGHGFARATESQFRRALLGVLAALGALGVIRSLWAAFV
jgi:uncharacterized membrane protein YfcA